jgi:hypothetical protein
LPAATTQIKRACSQSLGLPVLIDTHRAFHGYLLPCVNTAIWYSFSDATSALPKHLKKKLALLFSKAAF